MSIFIDQALSALKYFRSKEDSTDSSVVNLPPLAFLHFLRLAASKIKSSVCRVSVIKSEGWDTESFEDVLWRQVARRGRKVIRIYILPYAGFSQTYVTKQFQQDRAASVDPIIIVLSHLSNEMQLAARDFIIFDDSSVIMPYGSHNYLGDSSYWSVTIRSSDLEYALSCRDILLHNISSNKRTPNTIDLEEPLVLSADIIHGVAPVLCTSNHIDKTGCSWYHGVWQYLRLLNMVSTPTWHDKFYFGNLFNYISAPSPRVLISGTADYSLYAFVCRSAKLFQKTPSIYILDMCETPLFACRWYSKRYNTNLNLICEDIFSLKPGYQSMFDLICTDAFLTRFSPQEAFEIIRMWYNLLVPNGIIVTTVRLHEYLLPARDIEKLIYDFRSRATQRAAQWGAYMKPTPEEMGQLAENYARRMKSNNIGDKEYILSMFTHAGFHLLKTELAEVPGELSPTQYARIVARKG